MDDHLYDASLDGADELRAPRYLVGAAPRHVCDARLHSALLSDAQTKKEVTWLIAGWLIALVVLPLLMSYGIMPLWRDALHNYSNFSPYFFLSVLCDYVRLALVSILLVRTLAVWRLQREEKKENK